MNNRKVFEKLLHGLVIVCIFLMIILLEVIDPNPITKEEITVEDEKYDIKDSSINFEIDMMLSELNELMKEIDSTEDKKKWFLEYKSLINNIEESSNRFHPPETIYENYTDDEIYLMQRVIETEVYGGDFESKCNVASVILNRINDDRFENTPYEVINSPNQFVYFRTTISDDTILALEYAFSIGDTTNGSIFFNSNDKTETFSGATYLFTDNVGHNFYK